MTYADALAAITELGNRPDPKREAVEADTRIAALRSELADCKAPRLADGSLGGLMMFNDLLSSRNAREQRIRKLLQARRLQVRKEAPPARAEYLMHAAHWHRVEDRYVAIEDGTACPERRVG